MLIYTHLTALGPAFYCVSAFHQFVLNRKRTHSLFSDILCRVAPDSSSVGNICSTDIPQ